MNKSNKLLKLNLGCGKTRLPGVLGVDRVHIENYVDVVHDLDVTPYPFKDNCVSEIHMYHVLEHLHEPVKKVEEIHRILAPGGHLYIRVPHFSSLGAFSDITHIRPFGFTSFDYFDASNYHSFYTTARFKITNKQIRYFGLYPNNGVYGKYVHGNQCPFWFRPVVLFINKLISFSPMAFERFWCYWVGGATELVVDMECIK